MAEVKIGTWPCLLLAEAQVDNYVDLANNNEQYKRDLGVDHVELMPTSRFTPPQALYTLDGTHVAVGWCSPGVIVYKAVADSEPEEPEERPKDKEPEEGDSLPEQLGKELAEWLAKAGLLDIGLGLARVMSFLTPLAALVAVVLAVRYFWDEIKSIASAIAGVARAVWERIVGLAEFVRDGFAFVLGKLYDLGVVLADAVSFVAEHIVSFVKKLAEGAAWVLDQIAEGAWWLGGKIAEGAEAFWDWLTDSDFEWPWADVEPMIPNVEIPITEDRPRHCTTVAQVDTIIKLDADLLFDTDKAEIKDEAQGALKAAAKQIALMLQKDDWVRFDGYTDNTGSPKHNQELSEKRAEAVRSWFVKEGVVLMSKTRCEGNGEKFAKANDKEGREKERRVDIWLPSRGSTRTVCQ